jgi:pyruvate/2-oxoglutarate dehydrogenase complex dihydrolipoamide acyltransferase (E2) component
MTIKVSIPDVGMGVTEATMVNWLKRVGDRIEAGEPIAEIETAKSTLEIEAPAGGTLIRILAEIDDIVEVGTVIAIIED